MIDPKANPLFLRLFWGGAAVLALGGLVAAESVVSVGTAAGFLIAAAAAVPAYLWARGHACGLPIYPIVCLTYIWTCALPLVQGHQAVQNYSTGDQLTAAATVIGYLLLGTGVWWTLTASRPRVPRAYWGFPEARSGVFLTFLGCGCVFLSPLPWMVVSLPGTVHSALRMGTLALAILSAVVLAFQWGRQQLSMNVKATFAGLLVVYMLLDAGGLIIHGVAMLTFSTAAAFALGRGRVPYRLIIVAFVVFAVLHSGKWGMRKAYWGESPKPFPGYVEFYAEWVSEGVSEFVSGRFDPAAAERPQGSSVLSRASVIHMILLVQTNSPSQVEHLNGSTYEIIPALVLPRFLSTDKPWSHEGTYILSTHYGLQTRSQTLSTTIGFGLLAESYANFGWFGVLALAVLTGTVTGTAARWGATVPVTSFPGLFGFLVLSAFLQTEATAGVAVTSLVQGTLALLAVGLVLMRSTPNGERVPERSARLELAPAGGDA
ncbi:hypothetical protein R5W24_000940 [Gemmata sp. JC717]|uniref:hypothetical protein n=1 Tax=Gemmata algarum TaxID=2975278 RepID=UPI0021BB5DD8|nr:hypothetical protein [Gemmata algarum]MDY3551860.1 hypothetical protein [Gemmata algarum]